MRPLLPDLPLIFEGDSFIITLAPSGTKCVRILRILRYPNNRNGEGIEESFRDLNPEEKAAVIQQINRRHTGKSVIP